ncbi:LETM1-like protein-domain-containing protein [Paraphysoderma sedebokerense]|nr:LETM1-like protein-domain-containing protein [Paraphysoderma sedebokerense]
MLLKQLSLHSTLRLSHLTASTCRPLLFRHIGTSASPPKPPFTQRIKAFIQQYYNGIKLLKSNIPRYNSLKELPSRSLSRADFLFVDQTKKDVQILAPFIFCLVLIPELIPLLVIKGWVPSTCLSEEQIEKARAKLFEQRKYIADKILDQAGAEAFQHFKPTDLVTVSSISKLSAKYNEGFELNNIGGHQLRFYCKYMGLRSLGTKWFAKRRLEQYLEFLRTDDQKILSEGVQSLSSQELIKAVEARGISTSIPLSSTISDTKKLELQHLLNDWITLNHTMDKQIAKGLLVFSRMAVMGTILRRGDNAGNQKIVQGNK